MIPPPSPEVPNVGGEAAADDFTKRRKGSREAEPGHNAETMENDADKHCFCLK